ncbi:13238_t:CDS:2 [Cetraspora pellucida]|uniref:13238_t:CDS:1 n=1 Tax=Cetraspora pellucida TaxID=1433469 RepID=A0A9N9NGG8_9GLOM|nr:13238_t:CDS:2 [Cetraspora pellucida]
MLQDKQKDIDALIIVNNVLSTESNYYKNHWFSKLIDETSDWLKDLIIDVVEKHTPEPLKQFIRIPAVREHMFNLVFKVVSLRHRRD